MNILRKITLVLAGILLPIALLAFGYLMAVQQIIAKPDRVKHSLDQSKVYDVAVNSILDESKKEGSSDVPDELPVDDPGVRKRINEAVTPQLLQSQVEGAVDDIYQWLQGKTATLAFTFTLDSGKEKLATSLGAYAQERTSGLPVCASSQTLTIIQFNPLADTCRPSQVTPADSADIVKQEVLESNFFEDSTFTAEDLMADTDQTFQDGPQKYRLLTQSTYIAGGILVVASAGIIFLSLSRRKGLRRVACFYLPFGVLFVVTSIVAAWLIDKLVENLIKSESGELYVRLADALRLFAQDTRNWFLWYGLVLLIVSIVTLIVLKLVKPKVLPESDTPLVQPQSNVQGSGSPTSPSNQS